MSKRRRASSAASSREPEDDNMSEPEPVIVEPVRKRRRVDPVDICQQLYETIRNFKKEDGGLLCDAFIRAPKRRQEPAYYEVVANPIDLLRIQQKLKTDEYEDVDQLTVDVDLMVSNAKAFYKKTSSEYKDACELWDLYNMTRTRLLDPDSAESEAYESKGKLILKVGKLARRAAAAEARRDEGDEVASECSSSAQEDDSSLFEDLFTAVMMAQDSDGRSLHTAFQLLPSKKSYPEYYELIDSPIDLKVIATRIQSNQYASLNDLERDLQLMVKNAISFNEPGSLIYKDAKTLKRVISVKKVELETGRGSSSGKTSERIRSKRLRGGQSMSAITSALKYEDEEEDEEAEGMEEDDSDQEDEEDDDDDNEDEESSPLWTLFEAVSTFTNNTGYSLSDPFRKLPSKRFYPDYYKEIKNPISLYQIRTKLKQGHYGTVSEIAGDLNIMFENAKKYNRADSKIYKDAVKLQKIMQAKVQELLEYDQESDSDDDDDGDVPSTPTPSTRRGRPPGSLNKPKSKPDENTQRRKRYLQLYRTLLDFSDDGRQPILMFMEKPSKKLYPDYYQVIEHPIDMLSIEANIKADKYTNEDQLVSDFKLMFNNCRQYNEEGSVIYEDANKLERQLSAALNTPSRLAARANKAKKVQRNLYQKLRTLFDTIRDHKDVKGRQLSVIFNRLPSKIEYPDYYEVIKRPIDLEKISQKLKNTLYLSIDDMVSDFVLMFDNAFKYNEPDSQIYKDALMLQRVTLQTKLQLREDEEALPDVPLAVQELLTSLFTATYNHQDEDGRCFSDSMAELPEHDEVDGTKSRALSLDLIKRRLDRGFYRRLDQFQEDMFACLDRARRLSRSDSQVFEDAIELQSYFIKQRDELCKCGDLLHSPALRYSTQDLAANLDLLRQEKTLKELPEEETETRASDDAFKDAQPGDLESTGNEMSFNQQLYRVGEFVYLEPKERGLEPHIILIERLWTNQDNEQMLFGNYFYRPNETYHLTTRKFLEKEVFKSDVRAALPLSQVQGMCLVLNVRDYLKMKPETFPEKDVYVCESRYASKARSFKKIKLWTSQLPEHIKLINREEPLEPKRVMSVFRERVEKHKEEIAELDESEKLPEREPLPNVELTMEQPIENQTYFEQIRAPNCGSIKTGDCVYVKNGAKQSVLQVDTIWSTKDGGEFFKGPTFVPPSEIPNTPGRLFYKQELLHCTVEEVHPIANITGRCAVLEHAEYISCRPTEVTEGDVYVCESLYEEPKRLITKLLREGIKKYQHSGDVQDDEIYFFRRLINPAKIGSDGVQKDTKGLLFERDSSPVAGRDGDVSLMMEDSMDAPPSVGSGDTPTPSPSMPTPVSTVKKKGTGKKLVTGYILYSSDVRKSVASRFPESTFGEISRIVGNEWRSLTGTEKQGYEERAAKLNEETTARMALEAMGPGDTPHQDLLFECHWDSCDYQFEELNDLLEHAVGEPDGHVQKHFVTKPESEYQCQWKGCIRQKKTVPPFPSIMRLARHAKEQHILKASGRVVPPAERSRNFFPSAKKAAAAAKAAASPAPIPSSLPAGLHMASSGSGSASMPVMQAAAPIRQLEPMFVAVPPRPQRLLHSEAYIKYIEGIGSDSRHISNWERGLRATPEATVIPDASRLPAHWLANGTGNHGSVVNALWALRDYLLRDSLRLGKNA